MELEYRRMPIVGFVAIELSELTGYAAETSSLKNGLSKLRTLGLIHGRGQVELAAELRA
jgi:hypothetical protein